MDRLYPTCRRSYRDFAAPSCFRDVGSGRSGKVRGGQCCDDPVSPRSVGAGRCAAAPLEGSGCATRTAASAPLSTLSMLPGVICLLAVRMPALGQGLKTPSPYDGPLRPEHRKTLRDAGSAAKCQIRTSCPTDEQYQTEMTFGLLIRSPRWQSQLDHELPVMVHKDGQSPVEGRDQCQPWTVSELTPLPPYVRPIEQVWRKGRACLYGAAAH
jgi:hypothetical protein